MKKTQVVTCVSAVLTIAKDKGKSPAGAVAGPPPCLERNEKSQYNYYFLPVPQSVNDIPGGRSVWERLAFVKKRKNPISTAFFA
jgi:hypothetical protein